MTGPDLRAIRLELGLALIPWGRALGYTGDDKSVRVSTTRAETADRVPAQIERLARMYERFGVPKEFAAG